MSVYSLTNSESSALSSPITSPLPIDQSLDLSYSPALHGLPTIARDPTDVTSGQVYAPSPNCQVEQCQAPTTYACCAPECVAFNNHLPRRFAVCKGHAVFVAGDSLGDVKCPQCYACWQMQECEELRTPEIRRSLQKQLAFKRRAQQAKEKALRRAAEKLEKQAKKTAKLGQKSRVRGGAKRHQAAGTRTVKEVHDTAMSTLVLQTSA